MIVFGYQTIDNEKREKYKTNNKVLKSQPEIVYTILNNMNNGVWVAVPWNKVYKASIIKKLKFKSEYIGVEDLVFNLEYFNKCNTLTLIDKIGYNYAILSRRVKYREGTLQAHIKATEKLLDYFENKIDKKLYTETVSSFFYSSMFYDLIAITINKDIKMNEKLKKYKLLKTNELYKELKYPKIFTNKKKIFFKILNINNLLAYLFIKIYCRNWRN